jgi:hypothetical protein
LRLRGKHGRQNPSGDEKAYSNGYNSVPHDDSSDLNLRRLKRRRFG